MPPTGVEQTPVSSPAAVLARWEEIAGPTLARHVHPLRLSGEVLVVAVDEPAWATQVRMLSGTLLARIGEITGHAPTRLDVTVSGPSGGRASRSGTDGVG
jgi:predicted nucleic acid-binding Zn ribbon protein